MGKPPGGVRTSPLNATLRQMLDALAVDDAGAAWRAADATLRALYRKGLPRGLDHGLVAALLEVRPPYGDEIHSISARVGADYDAAILEGLRRHPVAGELALPLEVSLVALLAEHSGRTIADAYAALRRAEALAERVVERGPDARGADAALDAVAEAMVPWFAPQLAPHTLALAKERLGPTAWSHEGKRGVIPLQGSEAWALFIGCAAHPGEAAAEILAARAPLIDALDEPERSLARRVLRRA